MEERILNREPANEVDADRSILKLVAFLVVTALTAALFAFSLFEFSLVARLALGVALAALLVIQTLVVKSALRAFEWIAAETAALAAAVYFLRGGFPMNVLLAASAAACLILFLAHRNGRAESNGSLRVSVMRTARAVLPLATTALALFVSAVYGFETKPKDLFSQEAFARALAPMAPIVKFAVPNFSLDARVDDVIASLAERAASRGIEDFGALDEATKRAIVDKAIVEIRREAQNFFKTTLDLRAPVGEYLHDVFASSVGKSLEKAPPLYISLGVAAAIFLTIKGFSFLIIWVVTPVAWLIYELMIALGFAVVSLETRDREIVLLK